MGNFGGGGQPFGMQSPPNMMNWQKDHQQVHGSFREEDTMGGFGGLGTLRELPPPPRSAPAADGFPPPPRTAPAADGMHGMGGGSRHALKVLTSESKWEQLAFNASDRLESVS